MEQEKCWRILGLCAQVVNNTQLCFAEKSVAKPGNWRWLLLLEAERMLSSECTFFFLKEFLIGLGIQFRVPRHSIASDL